MKAKVYVRVPVGFENSMEPGHVIAVVNLPLGCVYRRGKTKSAALRALRKAIKEQEAKK